MKIKNSGAYNLIKEIYYRHFAYRKLFPIWDLKKKEVTFIYEGLKFKAALEEAYYAKTYFKPIFLSSIGIFNKDLKGYFYKRSLPTRGIIIDLGAYHGGFVTYLAKKRKGLKFLAFEPDPKNVSFLKKNLKLNNVNNMVLVKKGAWNSKKVLSFEQSGATGHISKQGKTKIQVTDLDSELKRLKIPFEKVSFIKMDIEGAEIEAIDGMKELLTKGSPQLAIASYHVRDGQKTYIEVERKLKALGYKVETGYPKHLTTWAWKD